MSLECNSEIDEEEIDAMVRSKTHCHMCDNQFPFYGRTGTIIPIHVHRECTSAIQMDVCWRCFFLVEPVSNHATRGCDECDRITLENGREEVRAHLESRVILLLAMKFSTFQ